MAVARMMEFETALPEAADDGVALRRSSVTPNSREYSVIREPSRVVSSVEQVPIAESAVAGGDMKIVRAPETVQKKTSVWSEISQTWEGRVVENLPSAREFVAIISDRTFRNNPDEEVVIGYESVIDSDIDLISEGAVFFWNVGKFRKYSESNGKIGPAVNKFELRFRRLPPISSETIEEIKNLSKGLSKIIHGN